uniref:DNA translocase FtsK n=1 Tax=Caldalkalibacillus salinus TaxID=2803787 RepID=UPI001923D720
DETMPQYESGDTEERLVNGDVQPELQQHQNQHQQQQQKQHQNQHQQQQQKQHQNQQQLSETKASVDTKQAEPTRPTTSLFSTPTQQVTMGKADEQSSQISQALPQASSSELESKTRHNTNQDQQPTVQNIRQAQQRRREARMQQTTIQSAGDSPTRDTQAETLEREPYSYPQSDLLKQTVQNRQQDTDWEKKQGERLLNTFSHFNLKAELIDVTRGPTVTRFEIQPAPGIKISKFTNLQDDIKLALAAKAIRIEAPIPGKQAIGIEVPNENPSPVLLGDLIHSEAFQSNDSPLSICLGSGIDGKPIVTDIQKMPHGLIAGATGSGKSVCVNTILVSLLYNASPEMLRVLLIDPKVVELVPYQKIPHLVTPVVTDPKKATAALKWAVEEMERRYQLFAQEGVRDLARYNQVMKTKTGESVTLPHLLIIIDELADLMMVAPSEVEESICRITQKARACGIHLLVATQRPSVDVITGLIKSNIPSRLAFAVSSQVDSRTILDSSGAERLLGKGDMLFLANGSPKPVRVQGCFVSDDEIEAVVNKVAQEETQHFLLKENDLHQPTGDSEAEDELIEEAGFFVMEQGAASTSSLQRKFRIGYNRAARMIDWMEEQGMISEAQGSKPRQVVWSQDQFLDWLDQRE